MPDLDRTIKSYRVHINGSGHKEYVAKIELRSDTSQEKSPPFGYIYFHEEGSTVPGDSIMGVGMGAYLVKMHLPERRLAAVLAFLREEEPVSQRWSESARYAWLESGVEPLGEEEGTGG